MQRFIQCQSLDEGFLGVRKSRSAPPDPDLPGFDAYGTGLVLANRAAGLKSYMLGAFMWHKV